MSQPLELYLSALSSTQAEVVCTLRALILQAVPGVVEDITRERIRYDRQGPVCVLRAQDAHVELLFPRGRELVDALGIPPARHLGRLKIHHAEDIWPELFQTLIQDAVELNRPTPPRMAGLRAG